MFRSSAEGKKINHFSKYWGSSTQDDPCRSNIGQGVATPATPAALTPMREEKGEIHVPACSNVCVPADDYNAHCSPAQRPRQTNAVAAASMQSFYPRDAMLARLLAMTLCPSVRVYVSVCLSVRHKSVFYRNGYAEFLAWRLLSIYPIRCCKEMHVLYLEKIRVLSSGTFS